MLYKPSPVSPPLELELELELILAHPPPPLQNHGRHSHLGDQVRITSEEDVDVFEGVPGEDSMLEIPGEF